MIPRLREIHSHIIQTSTTPMQSQTILSKYLNLFQVQGRLPAEKIFSALNNQHYITAEPPKIAKWLHPSKKHRRLLTSLQTVNAI